MKETFLQLELELPVWYEAPQNPEEKGKEKENEDFQVDHELTYYV